MKEQVEHLCKGKIPDAIPSFDDKAVAKSSPAEIESVTGYKPADYGTIASLIAPGKRIFFVGIGGISMCGLAELAHHEGALCAGSDPNPNARTAYLKELGLALYDYHDSSHIDRMAPDLVVYSKAVFDDNPERRRAAERGIPSVERAVFLGAINRLFPQVVNVSGTNGKSTCTAMCALMLIEAGMDPTVHLGAELINFQTTVRLSQTRKKGLFLSEACEFKRGFFHYQGTATLILNLVHDHIDSYRTHDDLVRAFAQYVAIQPRGSLLILPAYEADIGKMLSFIDQLRPGHLDYLSLIWFGSESDRTPCGKKPDYCYDKLHYNDQGEPRFDLYKKGRHLINLSLAIPGEFNVQNAMGAVVIADLAGAGPLAIQKALRAFRGAEGRFTRVGQFKGAQVIIDYAHHPSAIRLTIEAARRLPAKRLWICFQPLTHSRVRGFFDEFVNSMLDVDPIMMTEIYDDRETDRSISSKDISERINQLGGHAEFFPTNEALEEHLRKIVEPGDVVLIMGVDLRNVGDRLTGRTDHMKAIQ
ncbi:MAG: hypothetical protein GX838_02035 [Clostridiaceae bacterium]|nr:hypothetical protein [Clostridiaceae bacterium]